MGTQYWNNPSTPVFLILRHLALPNFKSAKYLKHFFFEES